MPEVSRGYATFATWLAKLRQHKVAAQFMKNAAEDELYGLYIAIKDIKKNDELYKEIVEALRTQDLKKVEDLIAGKSLKAEFASALLSYAKVAYSKNNDMAIKAIMYRINKLGQKGGGKAHYAASGSNVAIFEYIDLSGKIAYKEAIATGGDIGHAEKLIVDYLKIQKIPDKNVLRIYSELDACKSCTRLLGYFKNAKGFYSFEYNKTGISLWQKKLKELYKYFDNK